MHLFCCLQGFACQECHVFVLRLCLFLFNLDSIADWYLFKVTLVLIMTSWFVFFFFCNISIICYSSYVTSYLSAPIPKLSYYFITLSFMNKVAKKHVSACIYMKVRFNFIWVNSKKYILSWLHLTMRLFTFQRLSKCPNRYTMIIFFLSSCTNT